MPKCIIEQCNKDQLDGYDVCQGHGYNFGINKPVVALRYNADKPPLHLLAGEWQNEVAAVMGYGAKKYAPNNWRKGGPWCEHLASAQRHILAFQNGEDKDPESGLPHLAHAICSVFFVLEWVLQGKGTDDRHSAAV